MDCVRSIRFSIPGKNGKSDVEIYAFEVNGSLQFEITLLDGHGKTPDLRGLFFNLNDFSKTAGLTFSNDFGAISGLRTGLIDDMGHGANMKGKADPFHVGIEFGTPGQGHDDLETVSFTLSNHAKNLTLDDIANTLFGARLTSSGAKLTVVAPAAPDAVNDSYNIFEDGQSGLTAPSKISHGIVMQVLANDTDADGNTLTINHVEGALHGTVQIVDGDDADHLVGDAVLYTPDLDYAGKDSFTYCITDNHGGTDFADVQVNVEAVADAPLLSYEVLAGASVNEIRIVVTATQNDADSSEFIDRIALSGVPTGVLISEMGVNPGDQPDKIVHEFVLTLPAGQDTNFNLGITAFSQETSNGDQESSTVTLPIAYDYTLNQFHETYQATDQSMWSTGNQFTFTDDRFLGIDTSWDESGGSVLYGASNGNIKAGLQSTLTFEGGEIDAVVPYNITIETKYNKTTDTLLIGGDAVLDQSASFTTDGPEGSYMLNFLFNFFLHAEAGIDLGILGSWPAVNVDIGPVDESFNILDVDSDDAAVSIDIPPAMSLDFAWPNVDTASLASLSNVFSSAGESNNFIELGLDADDLLFTLLGVPNPFDVGFDATVVWANFELLDLDLSAGLNFLQKFAMTVNNLSGSIMFEDGSSQAFDFNTDIQLSHASSYDVDHDGIVEFELTLAPNATLRNDTDLGINVGFQFDVLKASGGYDIELDSGSFSLGPVFTVGDTADVATIDVYDTSFALNFGTDDLAFVA